MIFHENLLLADESHVISYFYQKLGKMLQNLPSPTVMIGALRVKYIKMNERVCKYFVWFGLR